MISYQLTEIESQWHFVSEAELEDFVWANLQSIFGLSPLKRQFSISGQFIDILAIDQDQNLTIIELKNAEDRHLIQQLTRYFDLISNSHDAVLKPVENTKIRLIGIMPSIHIFNKLDCKYNKLNFELYSFSISKHNQTFYWLLDQLDVKIEIPAWNKSEDFAIQPLSRDFLKWAHKFCGSESIDHLLRIREIILSSDMRMKEMQERGVFRYGSAKSKACAEIHIKSRKFSGGCLLLKLPDATYPSQQKLRLFYVSHSQDYSEFDGIAWMGSQSFNPSARSFEVMVQVLGDIAKSGNPDAQVAYDRYQAMIADGKTVEALIRMAILYWKERL
jgi:hypothetical protein